ncbi:flagellar protein [Mesobacillus subterraneus]|uniref:TIGR02530 family flagellar biosynthesis protein n=1 Tax=Mesobacillus subterraneus TaxID=285983 RepID=UPI00203DEE19|nr:TIGR02530 family flagellar biosynthesis protein [Mesobacillus subterraneus]MCM3665625.1 flagellar protein [Mesobacillus subterraneus]MCM3684371.1 flagellar protein [Mesobacillus subterraneus]
MEKANFRPIQSLPVSRNDKKPVKTNHLTQTPFSLQLQSAIQSKSKLTISKHASDRLVQRGIDISQDRWSRIEEKVKQAKAKGVTDSLVLLRDAALIVSAKNNTVITAMGRQEAAEQIFTNINGTIVMEI